ncbi:MAG: hypothetical protein KBC43_01325 [Bacteroidales bacterium]|nr:hypothetical protein [Bacteroidales bacterium]
MRDFTFKTYEKLLSGIRDSGYAFQTFEEFITSPAPRVVVLRHDSDIWPGNDLKMALLENRYGVRATYYFRIPYTFNIRIIRKVRELGHEIGYHYENLADAGGDYEKAIADFSRNLSLIREICPVRTIAMHGRPLSKWDSRTLWDRYNMADYGIIAEPYKSVDYQTVLYLTDTGSRWDGGRVSIRDTVVSGIDAPSVKTTFHLIRAFEQGKMPDMIIINAHAARWNDNPAVWIYRYFLQNAKNTAKYFLKFYRR